VEPVVVAGVTVLAVVLLYARAPFAAQQFWGEDGREFFVDAMRFGPVRSLGHSEAGYYLTFSRLGGVWASLVPIRAAALTMWIWVAFVVGWLVATVTVSTRTWLTTWPARIVVALSLVLLPVLGLESIGNAANLQFVMIFACVVVLIGEPRSRIETINGALVLLATGLTTPVAALLVPFVALRLFRRRSFRPDPLVLAWLVGVAVQLVAVAVTRPSGPDRSGEPIDVVLDRLDLAGFRLNLLPNDLGGAGGWLVMVAYVVVLGAVVWLAWSQRQRQRAVLLAAVPAFGVGTLLVLAWISGPANRYMTVPGLCLVWSVAAAAETIGAALPRSWRVSPTMMSAGVAALLLVTFVARWNPSDLRVSGPTWGESLDRAEQFCRDHPDAAARLQIAPMREDRPLQWSIVLACRDVD
jgi:hypothetical protein